MKILQFTLPISENKTIIIRDELLPHLYPYLHRHNEVQLSWILEGEGTLVVDNNMHAFKNNEIYWIGTNQPHVFKSESSYFQNKDSQQAHKIDIFFNPDAQLSPFFSIPEVKHLKDFILKHNCGFRVPDSMVDKISAKMLSVSQNTGSEQFLYFIDLLKTLSGCESLETLSTNSTTSTYSESEGIRIASIYNYVMQHYDEQITLENLANIAFMTPQALCRYFKKHTQNTLLSFINQIRINEACKKLLENKYEGIASVAYSTGFKSITNFNRVFKSITKKSPREYLDSYFCHVDTRKNELNLNDDSEISD
ncbi:MAG TPA: AraC family transcriptional regulator [Hanamia sp.]|jgi:AraC-like DNA-binding protein|nr:AraC family transcriptional regulator [Hanamia sp.]